MVTSVQFVGPTVRFVNIAIGSSYALPNGSAVFVKGAKFDPNLNPLSYFGVNVITGAVVDVVDMDVIVVAAQVVVAVP